MIFGSFGKPKRETPQNTKSAAFRTDSQFRASKRNLIWTSVAGILFSFSKNTNNASNSFDFSLLRITSSYNKSWFAVVLCLVLLGLLLRFYFDIRRILLLNSEAAVDSLLPREILTTSSSDTLSRNISEMVTTSTSKINTALTLIGEIHLDLSLVKSGINRQYNPGSSQYDEMRFEFPMKTLHRSVTKLQEVSAVASFSNGAEAYEFEIPKIVSDLQATSDQLIEIRAAFTAGSAATKTLDKFTQELSLLSAEVAKLHDIFESKLSIIESTRDELRSSIISLTSISSTIIREETLVHFVFDRIAPILFGFFSIIGCLSAVELSAFQRICIVCN